MNNGRLSYAERSRLSKKATATEAAILYSLVSAVSFFTAIIQTCFFFNFRPFGFAPDLCLALTVACAVKFGSKIGGVAGLSAGFFLGAFSSPGITLASLFYTVIGIVVGVVASPEVSAKLSHFSIFILGVGSGAALSGLSGFIRICVTHSTAPLATYVAKSVFPEIFCTVLFSPAVYLLTAIVARQIRKKQGMSMRNNTSASSNKNLG